MHTVIAFWNILKKDIETYYLKPPNISWGIVFPLSWTLMQLIRLGGGTGVEELLPGLMAMSVLFGTTSMLAVTITFERKGRSFDRLLIAPLGVGVLIFAKILGAVLFGMFNAIVPVILAAFFHKSKWCKLDSCRDWRCADCRDISTAGLGDRCIGKGSV